MQRIWAMEVEMVVHTRLDCVIGSSALMRLSAQLAFHHVTWLRRALGQLGRHWRMAQELM